MSGCARGKTGCWQLLLRTASAAGSDYCGELLKAARFLTCHKGGVELSGVQTKIKTAPNGLRKLED